jgi:dTDP-4-amino-4,6-dideoxygalactose transaminase
VNTSDKGSLQARLTKTDIGTLIYHPFPLHMQAAYVGLGILLRTLLMVRELSDNGLSLPTGPQLESKQMNEVVIIIGLQ